MKKLIITLALTLVWMTTANAASNKLMVSAKNDAVMGSTGIIITERWGFNYICDINGAVKVAILAPVEPGGKILSVTEVRIDQRPVGKKLWIKAWSTKNPSVPFTMALDRLVQSYDMKEFRIVYTHIDGTVAFESQPFTGTEFNTVARNQRPAHCSTGYTEPASKWMYISSNGKW